MSDDQSRAAKAPILPVAVIIFCSIRALCLRAVRKAFTGWLQAAARNAIPDEISIKVRQKEKPIP